MRTGLKLTIFLLIWVCYFTQFTMAESNRVLCAKHTGELIVRKNCRRLPSVCNPCSSCGMNLSGEWNYVLFNKSNDASPPRTITLSQTNDAFSGSGESHTIVGKVSGNWVKMTFTVSGEENEGWVALAEGTVRTPEVAEGEESRTYMNVVIVGETAGQDYAQRTAGWFWRVNP